MECMICMIPFLGKFYSAQRVTSKVVKNAFLTRHGTSNTNSNRKIVKSQIKYFN